MVDHIQINHDVSITFNGFAYSLNIESYQWGIDTLMPYAIAANSGIRFVLLDRLDVPDLNGPTDVLAMIDDLIA
ncbi:MAG: hypothetical protein ACK4FF_05130 [Limnobacter sp.]|uniref:hypothetical protein n=1 Tax=Limnobacter sp. TaxID=2003368 RepID=UPI00391BAFC4